MGITAAQLIERSWRLSGIVSPAVQTMTGQQATQGLELLNALLDFKSVELDLLPYYTYISFPCVPGQENYYLPSVALIETCTFNLDVVRFSMISNSRRAYYGSSRVDNITTLPFSYNFERILQGGVLALYFIPDNNYPIKAQVKIFLKDVSLTTDLTNITSNFENPDDIPNFTPYTFINNSNQGFDASYIEYLRYALAAMMCAEYGIIFNPESQKILDSYKRKLMYMSPPDVTAVKRSVLNADRPGVLTWAFVNLSGGWVP